jgi:hypothetical protein
MCCDKPDLRNPDLPWWKRVISVGPETTFGSEQDALAFLNRGIDNVPEHLQKFYAALHFHLDSASN